MAERILAYKITVTGTEAQVKELGRHDIAIKKLAGDTRLLEKRALELANQNKKQNKLPLKRLCNQRLNLKD